MPTPLTIEERQLKKRTTGERIFALDALRGIAACIVVFYHLHLMFVGWPPRWYLYPFLSGHQSVVLFFVLSGYVLSLSYWRGRALPYARYLVRRLFRIWVPYAAMLLIAAFGAWKFNNAQLPLPHWFYDTWHTPVTLKLIGSELLMRGSSELSTAFWSLRYEVEMSIIFPLIGMLLLRIRPWGGVLFGIGLSLIGTRMLSATVLWSSCFVLGASLAGMRTEIKSWYSRTPSIVRWILLASSLALYLSANDQIVTAGSCGLIALIPNSRLTHWLDTVVPEYLGRISYSLYLAHGTVLYALTILLYGKMPTPLLIALVLLVTFLFSHIFCIFVEEKSTLFGRRLTRGPKSSL